MIPPTDPGLNHPARPCPPLPFLLLICALTMGVALDTYARLTYHEAFVAQGAREIVNSGNWSFPSIGGLPWLEKPPLPFWLVAMLGWCFGEVSPGLARLPSLVSATLLVLGVYRLAVRRHGTAIGQLAGAVQATTAWTVMRGRLAEADILLACLITWALVAFDVLRMPAQDEERGGDVSNSRAWRWAFFTLLGLTALVKGITFGPILVVAVVLGVLLWERDQETLRRLAFPPGWLLTVFLALSWPAAMIARHGPPALDLWLLHVVERLRPLEKHGPFAGESWLDYVANVLGQGLPWTPLAILGLWAALRRRGSGRDSLLWAWTLLPMLLVSVPSGRNAHYAIHAMVPWSVWAAIGLDRLACRLATRGWQRDRLHRGLLGLMVVLALGYGLGYWLVGPRFDRRGIEWGFYERVSAELRPGEPVVLLYDDWDRDPYPTPFGPIPHDLGVRLFYLNRPVCWHFDVASIVAHDAGRCHGAGTMPEGASVVVLGRERDLPALEASGPLEVLDHGPPVRWDRTYLLARFWPPSPPQATKSTAGLGAAFAFH